MNGGRKRKTAPNAALTPAVHKRPALLAQYNFTPAQTNPVANQSTEEHARPSKPPPPGDRDNPPPINLFQNSPSQEMENSGNPHSGTRSRPSSEGNNFHDAVDIVPELQVYSQQGF
ncbi:unnamed protein product [Cochlearia groenlandica]